MFVCVCVCVCVCVPADASQAFSTYSEGALQAASPVSASATRWPAPRPITTLLSTSPLTSWKVFVWGSAACGDFVITQLKINKTNDVYFVLFVSLFYLPTIVYCAFIYRWWSASSDVTELLGCIVGNVGSRFYKREEECVEQKWLLSSCFHTVHNETDRVMGAMLDQSAALQNPVPTLPTMQLKPINPLDPQKASYYCYY